MNAVGWAFLALVAGIAVGVGLTVWWTRRRQREALPIGPQVPDGVAEVLSALRSAGIVVGPHDEVLQATDLARSLGLARGSRVAAPILDMVRSVRQQQVLHAEDLEMPRGTEAAGLFLSVRVAPLEAGLVLVLADDETNARRVEQTRRDFVANVSHELKTPVGALSLLAEAIEEAADDPPAVRRFAARMGIESARLTDLVSQIIDLTRLQADNPLDSPEVIDLDDVLTEAVDRCQVDADRHQVGLTIAGAEDCQVLGSARQLGIAVGNLVENAVVYSDPGARVVVAAHRRRREAPGGGSDDWVDITVSDTGIGIGKADLDRVFERFYRVDYARSRANGGTGLGLSIVKHIAATHHGEVTVWSQLGRGSTFTIQLPEHTNPDPRVHVSTGTPTTEPVRPVALVPTPRRS